MIVSLSCPEITIKGANRHTFENMLVRNLRSSLSGVGKFEFHKRAGRVLIFSDDGDEESCKSALLRTFGIDTISFCERTRPEIGEIEKTVLARLPDFKGKTIRVEAKRSDKSFPLTSQEINQKIGHALVLAGCKVDLHSPEKTIFIDILPDEALISFGKIRALGGLPVGSSGKVLSLLSGGIDSPVSSWMMMKRGCSVDLLHVHQSITGKEVMETKIPRLASKISGYSPDRIRLYLAPYSEFYKKTLNIDNRRELIVFRRFLFHLSNGLAEKHGYQGVVTGDSIGQVASQTLPNILSSDEASTIPVFRPVVALNKPEIVSIAEAIGTFKDSIEPYKDCCSLISAKSPSTSVPLNLAKKIENDIGMAEIVKKTLEMTEVFEI